MAEFIGPESEVDTLKQQNQRLWVKVGELTKLAAHLKKERDEPRHAEVDQRIARAEAGSQWQSMRKD